MQLSTMFPPGAAGPFGGTTYPEPDDRMTAAPPAPGPFQAAPIAPQATAMAPTTAAGPYGQPPPVERVQPKAIQDRMSLMVPALIAAFGPKIGARGVASMLTGIMRGRDAKLAQQEQVEETQRRRAFEAATFRKNATDELLQSETVEELEAKLAGLQSMADYHGVDLHSAMSQAAGVVQGRVEETATRSQRSQAADVVKANDQTNPGQWSAEDETGTMRPRAWWVQRAGAPGLLPGKAPEPEKVTFSAPVVRMVNGQRTDVQRGSDGYWYTLDNQRIPANAVTPEAERQPQGPAAPTFELVGPNGEQRIVQGVAQANALLGQGWKKLDPTAIRNQTGGSDAEALDTAREVQRIARDLRDSPGFSGAFGKWSAAVPGIMASQDAINARTKLKSLQGLLTLENMGKMKGVLSDSDMRIIRSASTTLAEEMSEADALDELNRLGQAMSRLTGEPWDGAQVSNPPPQPTPRGGGAGPVGRVGRFEIVDQR